MIQTQTMDEKNKLPPEEQNRKTDHKRTAGDLPEMEEQFEDTSWVKNADHGVDATEAERKNVSKTLPKTAVKEQKETKK